MAKKKKLTKAERKEARLRKGKQWLLTYTGSPKKMNKHYRERFHVDAVTAAKDLQGLGVNYTQEQLDQIKQAEEQRLRQRRMQIKIIRARSHMKSILSGSCNGLLAQRSRTLLPCLKILTHCSKTQTRINPSLGTISLVRIFL